VPDPTLTRTERGFALLQFTDRSGESCSLQKSSAAEEDCIWLGRDGTQEPTRMHLNQEQVGALLPHLHRFARTGELDPEYAAEGPPAGAATLAVELDGLMTRLMQDGRDHDADLVFRVIEWIKESEEERSPGAVALPACHPGDCAASLPPPDGEGIKHVHHCEHGRIHVWEGDGWKAMTHVAEGRS
jgi:hypothetical protein